MSSLPEDIIEENILTRLPVKSIARFRCVSTKWRLLFRNPTFIKNHLNHAVRMNKFNILVIDYKDNNDETKEASLYSVDHDVLSSTSSPFLGHAHKIDYPFMSRRIVPGIQGSCNGLVCIHPVSEYEFLCIWNPATREYKQVPAPSVGSKDAFIAHGFGFDCKNDDYKVLTIVRFQGRKITEARLYSLRSNSWKNLGVVPYDDFSFDRLSGVLHNGVLHWVTNSNRLTSSVVCFDISDETFHNVPLPNNISRKTSLGILDRKLCLLHMNRGDHDYIDLWTRMDNKWNKHLKITVNINDMVHLRSIQTLHNGEILFVSVFVREDSFGLVSYDPMLERAKALKIHGFPDDPEVHTYIETLVALNSGTYIEQ